MMMMIKPVTRYAGPTEIDQVYYVNSNEDDEIRGSAGAAIRRRDVNELFYPAHGGQCLLYAPSSQVH